MDKSSPDWVVTSPPYQDAFAILKQALRFGRVGVAFKMRLTSYFSIAHQNQGTMA